MIKKLLTTTALLASVAGGAMAQQTGSYSPGVEVSRSPVGSSATIESTITGCLVIGNNRIENNPQTRYTGPGLIGQTDIGDTADSCPANREDLITRVIGDGITFTDSGGAQIVTTYTGTPLASAPVTSAPSGPFTLYRVSDGSAVSVTCEGHTPLSISYRIDGGPRQQVFSSDISASSIQCAADATGAEAHLAAASSNGISGFTVTNPNPAPANRDDDDSGWSTTWTDNNDNTESRTRTITVRDEYDDPATEALVLSVPNRADLSSRRTSSAEDFANGIVTWEFTETRDIPVDDPRHSDYVDPNAAVAGPVISYDLIYNDAGDEVSFTCQFVPFPNNPAISIAQYTIDGGAPAFSVIAGEDCSTRPE